MGRCLCKIHGAQAFVCTCSHLEAETLARRVTSPFVLIRFQYLGEDAAHFRLCTTCVVALRVGSQTTFQLTDEDSAEETLFERMPSAGTCAKCWDEAVA